MQVNCVKALEGGFPELSVAADSLKEAQLVHKTWDRLQLCDVVVY